jgi:hypothetical protein
MVHIQDWWNFPFFQVDANCYICGFDIAFHLWFVQIIFYEIWLVWIWWNDRYSKQTKLIQDAVDIQ